MSVCAHDQEVGLFFVNKCRQDPFGRAIPYGVFAGIAHALQCSDVVFQVLPVGIGFVVVDVGAHDEGTGGFHSVQEPVMGLFAPDMQGMLEGFGIGLRKIEGYGYFWYSAGSKAAWLSPGTACKVGVLRKGLRASKGFKVI